MIKLKWIFCGALFLLAGCAAKTQQPQALQTPSVAETKEIETQFSIAHDTLPTAWANYAPIKQADGSLIWRMRAPVAFSFSNAASLDIEPADDDRLTIQVFNRPTAELSGTVVRDVLAVKLDSMLAGKVVIHLPAKTKYLRLANIQSMKANVDQHLMYLNMRDSGYIKMQSQAWMLQYLYLNNTRQAELSGVTTPYLLTWVKDSGVIKVHGTMGLRELDVQNSNLVEMYWLNSPILKLNILDSSNVFLAGDVTYANSKISGHSKLDDKYLRVHRLFVKTEDSATAHVTALDELNALATGNSNIYYYNQPKILSRYYQDNGSVIYMGEAPPACHAAQCLVLPRVLPG